MASAFGSAIANVLQLLGYVMVILPQVTLLSAISNSSSLVDDYGTQLSECVDARLAPVRYCRERIILTSSLAGGAARARAESDVPQKTVAAASETVPLLRTAGRLLACWRVTPKRERRCAMRPASDAGRVFH